MVHRNHLIFLLLGVALLLSGCATQTTIVNNIGEREANEIVVLLASKGIDAAKTPTTVTAIGAAATAEQKWDITVPSNQITQAIAILNQTGLPRAKGTNLLDLFGPQGLVPSDLQDKIRYQEGLSEQLATTIRKMDGIIDANVQITFPRDEETEKELTASVYVKHRGVLDNPNSLMVTKIKRLIASAIPNLTVDNVSVIADRALYADITLGTPEAQLEMRRDYISIWSIVIAKDSVSRFRVIFYTFLILLFLFICSLAWFIWKFYPIIKEKGGWKTLFHPNQFEPGAFTTPKKPPEEEEEE